MLTPFKYLSAAMVLFAAPCAALSAEPLPAPIGALNGCWEGEGKVQDKAVVVAVNAYTILDGAMLAVEVASTALESENDDYAAHLLFGGAKGGRIVGYWADSFGGDGATSGQGEGRTDGFDITYDYADAAFVNRWRVTGDNLNWQIVARDRKGAEKPFAAYTLKKAACRSSD